MICELDERDERNEQARRQRWPWVVWRTACVLFMALIFGAACLSPLWHR